MRRGACRRRCLGDAGLELGDGLLKLGHLVAQGRGLPLAGGNAAVALLDRDAGVLKQLFPRAGLAEAVDITDEAAVEACVQRALATLGRLGLVTVLMRALGVDIYNDLGFNILSFWGLTLTYLYFQIPLMVLILTPALDGLKREWREASEILGASAFQYWVHVAFPILWPSVLGCTLLLFANAFGAVATAFALTGSSLNIVPILLFAQLS